MIERSLERFVQQQMIATRIPGLSLVLIRDGESVQRHFGFRDLASRTAPTGGTRYGIGSVTKVFTAIAALQLVQEGTIGLDDPVASRLPDDAAVLGSATLRQVLGHASGLPALGWSETKMSPFWPMDGFPISGYEDLATFTDGAQAWRTSEPGERWQYSNEGYILLGRLLERVDGASYSEALSERVLRPLGMERSTFGPQRVATDENRVQPYLHDADGRLVPGSNLYGAMPSAGGLVSTPDDMTLLARFLLDGGRSAEGRALLRLDLVEAMAAPDVAIDPESPLDDTDLWSDPPRFNGAGLQRHRDVLGHDVWAHGGGVMGGTAYVAAMPTAASAVVVLANAHGYPLAQLALVALASLLGHPPDALPFVRRQRVVGRVAGTYASWADTIRADLVPQAWGVELRFAFEPVARVVPLIPLTHDEDRDVIRFLALGSGRPDIAEIGPADDGTLELRYERYALRRRGEYSP